MRLLVVGRLSGQLATAVKMAMAHGAKVNHVERADQATHAERGDQATTTDRLEAPLAEGNLRATSRQTFIAALMFLTELATIRLQHVKHLPFLRRASELRRQPS